MLSVTKKRTGAMAPHPAPPSPEDRQLFQDRVTAVIVLVAVAALMALVVWLSSLSGGGGVPEGVDYWPMMP